MRDKLRRLGEQEESTSPCRGAGQVVDARRWDEETRTTLYACAHCEALFDEDDLVNDDEIPEHDERW